jgi:hypothetical protein
MGTPQPMNRGLTDPPPIDSRDSQRPIVHGSMGAYARYGCRCVHCTLANTVRMREYRGGGERRTAQHGSRAKYVAGCRCEPCTRANREYQRVYMRLWRQGISMTADWEDWT